MKIIDIEVIELRVPSERTLDLDPTNNACLIRIHTDEGISGIAEVDSLPSVIKAIIEAPPRINTLKGLKSILIGEDPRNIASLWQKMYQQTSYCGRRGIVMHAISGIDIALWDLKGKIEGKTISQLLGNVQHKKLSAYITIYPLGRTIASLHKALDIGLSYPVKALKLAIDPFWRDEPELATRLLYAAREYVGKDIRLMLDATASFQHYGDIEWLIPSLKACNIEWLEAPFPLDHIAEFAKLQQTGIPVGAGDTGLTAPAEWLPYFKQGKINIAQPDISWVGGFSALLEIARLAKQHGCRLIPHGWNTDITLAANLHFLAVQDKSEFAEYSTSSSPLRWKLATNGPKIDDLGMIELPQGPGLGIELDESIIATYRID